MSEMEIDEYSQKQTITIHTKVTRAGEMFAKCMEASRKDISSSMEGG